MYTNNQNTSSAFPSVNIKTTWNNHLVNNPHQIPNGSGIWPNYNNLLQMPSATIGSSSSDILGVNEEAEELGALKEMTYKMAAMQPVDIDPATISKPERRNVRISNNPRSVAARHRRERISEKIEILRRLVPGGTKMDTASMLDEAISYVKFLKRQIRLLQSTPHPQTQQQCTIHLPPPPPPNPNPTPACDHCLFAPNMFLGSTTADMPSEQGAEWFNYY